MLLALLLVGFGGLGGCLRPLADPTGIDPALDDIVIAYRSTVAAALDDPQLDWHAGWLGNTAVEHGRADDVGYCWHWQTIVRDGVAEAVEDAGWAWRGIGAHQGHPLEHHALLVHDPRRVRAEDLLAGDPAAGTAWVLDPWIRGRPDVYDAAAWIRRMGRTTELVAVWPRTSFGPGAPGQR
ncbi:MAG: hypothetical protein AB8G96_01740 [Phycisphaerales bacterium]